MNDFFDSLKDIKKELQKEQNANLSSNSAAKNAAKQNLKSEPKTFSKEEAIAHKEQNLRDEFLAYVKDADIKKC
jgi:hypothetical protein|nr:hypothetical protein [uncultured Campylobacter sp.]